LGVYHNIYTEVLFNGKWINIDSRVLGLDGKIRTTSLMWGKSWLHEAVEELSEQAYDVTFDKLADGTKEMLGGYESASERSFEAVDFQTAIKDKIKSSPARRGYVYRSDIATFQIGEIDCIEWWITPADYEKLDKEEQQEYSYYEWDDRDGWYCVFKQIAYKVGFLVENFNDRGIPLEMYGNLDEKEIKAKDVRLVITRS